MGVASVASPRPRRGWRWLAGPLLAGASVGLVVLALEAATRLRLGPAEQDALPHVGVDGETQRRLEWFERARVDPDGWLLDVPDPRLGWRPKPGISVRSVRPESYDVTVTINAQGLRGRSDVERQRVPGRTRVAVFGCSQTFGSGVEDGETFSARLETLLPGVEVLNFGVHGYGTDQMLLRWMEQGRHFAPDVVVLAFAYYHMDRNVSGFRFYAKPRFALEPGGGLRLIGVPVPAPAELAETRPAPPWPLADRSVLARWLWERELRRRHLLLYQAEGPAWELTRAIIARFAASVQAHGARLVLLNIDEDAPWLSEPLGALARELGVVWADAAPALAAPRRRGVRLRLPFDPHMNPDGHAVLAAVLRDALCADPPLPGCAADRAAVAPPA